MSSVLDRPASGLLLARARWNAGLTKVALARRINVTAKTISNLEKGGTPSEETAKAIADYFKVEVTDLFEIPWSGR